MRRVLNNVIVHFDVRIADQRPHNSFSVVVLHASRSSCIPWSYLPYGFSATSSSSPSNVLTGIYFLLQPLGYWRERWPTSDGDFVDIDWLPAEEPVKDDPRVCTRLSLECAPPKAADLNKKKTFTCAVELVCCCAGDVFSICDFVFLVDVLVLPTPDKTRKRPATL